MKMVEVARFEFGYQARRPFTWLYFAAALGLSFTITAARTEEALGGGHWVNAPYVIALLTAIGSIMGLLASAAFAGEAGARDPESRMAALVYTSPLQEKSYVTGRFIAAFLLNALVLALFQVAMLVVVLVYTIPPELVGPIRISTYLSALVLLGLPNAFLATALLFGLSLLTRRSVSSYLGAVILFFISIFVYGIVASRMGMWELAKVLDPLGVTVLSEISKTTTGAQKNALDLWSSSSLLINRAVWLTVAATIVAITHLRFRFETAGTRTWWKRSAESPTGLEIRERSVPITVPRVDTASGSSVRIQQLVTIISESFRQIAISWGGLILVLLSLITAILGPKAMAHFGVPVVPTTEQMISWIGHPGEIIWFIVPILSAYYAGELVWRDRETRLSEIADATPVPEWVQMVGRYVGLALLLVAYQVMLIIACMVIQTQMGYHTYEPGLYIRAVLGLSLIEHLLFAGLAFALHVIINQKYVAYLAIVGVYVFMTQAPGMGIENHLAIFGSSPEWTYSDMIGFGPSISPWMWYKAYWAGIVVLLCVAAVLFWVRGREQGFKARIAIARERLSAGSIGIAIAMVALIIGTSGFIVYNTTVLNPDVSLDARLDARAKYEKTYGKFANLPQPRLNGISIRAELYPKDHEAVVHTMYTLVNHTTSPISAIHFLPDNEVETSEATFDRPAKATVNDKTLYYSIYELSSPLLPGDSVRVSFDVRFKPKGFTNDGVDASVVANGTYFEGLDWLPDIGYQREKELGTKVDRMQHGLGPREEIPSLDDPAARYRGSAHRIAFDATIATDLDQTAVAPGELRRTWAENGRRYFHYVADAPIRNDFAIYSARYAVATAKWNDVQIQIVHHPGHTTNVDRMIASARASLDYFTKNFGPYPYKELRFVEQPGQSMTLHASPINISYQEAFAGLNSGADPRKFDLAYAAAAHEIGHQWWGNQLSPADVQGAPLLTESLAWYSAMCIVAASHGEDHLQRLLDMFHGSAWMISRGGSPLLRIYDRWAAYRKGPFAMMALREYIGESQVNAALRRLFDKYKAGEPPQPLSTDLYSELVAVTPDSLRSFLSDLFERNTYWEVSTKSVTADSIGNGKWRVTLEVLARKVIVDKQGAEKEIPMNDLVEIGVYSVGGTTTRGIELHRALHRIKTGTQRVTVIVDKKPIRAGIDPRYLLIDDEPENNILEIQ
jgi:ABC-type transport system involved in multi-copper enzyme maturation permease subunit